MRGRFIIRFIVSIILIAFTEGFISQVTEEPTFIFILPITYVLLAVALSALLR